MDQKTTSSDEPIEEQVTIEGDQPLTPDDTSNIPPEEPVGTPADTQPQKQPKDLKKGKFLHALWPPTKKQFLIAGVVVVVVLLLVGLITPLRNAVAGLVFKTSATLEVYDEFKSESGNTQKLQLSDIEVRIDDKVVAAKATSPIKLTKLRPGSRTVTISKPNYKTHSLKLQANLRLGSQTNSASFKLRATGKPVKVAVINTITSEPLEDASITVAGSAAKSDSKGQALVVLPVSTTKEYEATIKKTGFNEHKQMLQVPTEPNPKSVKIALTPAGKIYFLSKQSGKIDVVKTNLDGSEREVVLAGTGKEDAATTTLISTTDWRYLALHTRRSDKNYQILLIDTQTDNNTLIDEGNVAFELEGWSGKYLVYDATSNVAPVYQAGKYKIKTFNAETKVLKTVYQNAATGNSTYDYSAEYPATATVIGDKIIYDIQNNQAGFSHPPAQGSIRVVDLSGANAKTIHSYEPAKGYLSLDYISNKAVYYSFTEYTTTSPEQNTQYYEVGPDGKFKQTQKNDKTDQYTYFQSPDGARTLWGEEQDGKTAVFVGDANGSSQKELYRLSELKPFGWFSNDYVLYSKNNSELYIAAVKEKAEFKKISDYHRPSQVNFLGYGGGYGGAY